MGVRNRQLGSAFSGRHWLFWLLLAATTGLALHSVWAAWAFETDDAYITLRYSEHLIEGRGLRWNPGADPIEGYSNFLYVLVGAAAVNLGAPPMMLLKIVGVLAFGATAVLLYRLARLQADPALAMTAPFLLLAHPFGGWWAVSGLETPTYALWVVASTAAYLRGLGYRPLSRVMGSAVVVGRRSIAHLRLAGLLAFLASITRPEGPVVIMAIALATAVRILSCSHRFRRDTFRTEIENLGIVVGAFAFPFCVYTAWRFGHFGRLFPNPVHCKADYGGDPWVLVRDFAPVAAVTLALAAPAWRRMAAAPQVISFAVACSYAVMLYGVQPVVGYGHRHFLAAYALLCVPASVGLAALGRNQRLRQAWIIGSLLVALLFLWFGLAIGEHLRAHANRYRDRMSARAQVARWLNDHLEAGERYVLGDVGLVGYQTMSLEVIDLYCLNNPIMTRPPVQGSPDALADAIMADPPAAIVVSSRQAEYCEPRSQKFEALLRHPSFSVFELAAVYGASGDDFHYFIYARDP